MVDGRRARRIFYAARPVCTGAAARVFNGVVRAREDRRASALDLPVVGAVHADTILTTWVVMILSLAFFCVDRARRTGRTASTRRKRRSRGSSTTSPTLRSARWDRQGEPFVPFFVGSSSSSGSLNQFGILPFKALGLPFGGSPTADLNTTVPLALFVFFVIQIVAIPHERASRRYAHLFKPFWSLFPINVLEEIARPVTLARACSSTSSSASCCFSSSRRSSSATSRSARSTSRSSRPSCRSSSSSSTSSSARSKRSSSPSSRSSISRWRSPRNDH